MNLRVFLRPHPDRVPENNGIGRIVYAQYRYLPDFGIDLVDQMEDADVTAAHIVTDPKGMDPGWGRSDVPQFDIQHCHGLYWTGDHGWGRYSAGHTEINAKIVEQLRRAKLVTVPSPWVAVPFKRDMHISPVVIGHGLDFEHWEPGENGGYVLWNKSRNSDVCDPTPALELAMRGIEVVSTFAPDGVNVPPNMTVTGHLAHPAMREVIRNADVYLATTPETFGIGTLEAMACGIPVLGYDWGGTHDLIEHERTGYLVPPGDIDGLLDGLEWVKANRAHLGVACQEVAARYDWPKVIGQYADLYRNVHDAKREEVTGVSVIITNHNYGRFVAGAVESALNQTRPVDEIIVVDDGSTDDSLDTLSRYRERVRVIAKENGGVASARNAGAEAARYPLLTFLDADDRIAPEFVATLASALEADRSLGIAYSRIAFIGPDDELHPSSWFGHFDWSEQSRPDVPPVGMIPSACMFRRDMWARAGGVKQDYAPGEDSEFWTRGLSVGYRAQCVTDQPLFHYRNHPDGAHMRLRYVATDTWSPWMRDRQFPLGAPSAATSARSYSQPAVSVILIDPDTSRDTVNELDKLHGQTLREWEAHVVTTDELPSAYIWATRHYTLYHALLACAAPVVFVVNVIDWKPDTLATMLRVFGATDGRILAGHGMAILSTEDAEALGVERLELLMGCGCNNATAQAAAQAAGLVPPALPNGRSPADARIERALLAAMAAPIEPDKVRMEYLGRNDGPISYTVNGRIYRGARVGEYHIQDVPREDVAGLLAHGKFRVLKEERPQDDPGVLFRYVGSGQRHITGANGAIIATVGANARDRFMRANVGDVEHLRRMYPGVLIEAGVQVPGT